MKKLCVGLLLLSGCAHTPEGNCHKPAGSDGPVICDLGPVLWFSHGNLVDKRLFQQQPAQLQSPPAIPEEKKPVEAKKKK